MRARVILVLGIVIFVVGGAYLYSFLTQPTDTGSAGFEAPGQTTTAVGSTVGNSGSTTLGGASTNADTPEQVETAFIHRATSENILDNSTYLDNRLINGNPDAIISVTQNWNPGGQNGTYNGHPIGVWYDSNVGQWAVFNQDRAAMPQGTAFNISIVGGTTQTR